MEPKNNTKKIVISILGLAVAGVFVFWYVENKPAAVTSPQNGSQEAKRAAVESVIKDAKQVSAIDITGCKPTPAVAEFAMNSKIDFKNADAKSHDISFSPDRNYRIPPKGKLTVTFNFYKFPGIRNYTCDTKPAGSIVIKN